MEDSFKKLHLRFNSSKCKVNKFTRRKKPPNLKIKVNGQIILRRKHIKILAVIFNRKLSFKNQIKAICVMFKNIDVLNSMLWQKWNRPRICNSSMSQSISIQAGLMFFSYQQLCQT